VKVSNRIDEVTGRIRRNGRQKVMRGRGNNAREKMEPGRNHGQQARLSEEDKHGICSVCTLYQTYECQGAE
jgi:hypothetical protein